MPAGTRQGSRTHIKLLTSAIGPLLCEAAGIRDSPLWATLPWQSPWETCLLPISQGTGSCSQPGHSLPLRPVGLAGEERAHRFSAAHFLWRQTLHPLHIQPASPESASWFLGHDIGHKPLTTLLAKYPGVLASFSSPDQCLSSALGSCLHFGILSGLL